MIETVLLGLAAYLLGSLPGAIYVCRLYHAPDPRSAGSGNPGTANVYRLAGGAAALLTLMLDVLKGSLPVIIALRLSLPPLSVSLVALAACLGHSYPLFFHFRGGKSVATALGAILVIEPWLALLLIGSWGAMVLMTGYSSFASLCSALLAPMLAWWLAPAYLGLFTLLSLLLLWRHRPNLQRLFRASELPARHPPKKHNK